MAYYGRGVRAEKDISRTATVTELSENMNGHVRRRAARRREESWDAAFVSTSIVLDLDHARPREVDIDRGIGRSVIVRLYIRRYRIVALSLHREARLGLP